MSRVGGDDPQDYYRTEEKIWGVTLHMVTVGLLTDPEDGQTISFQFPKKKRKLSEIKTEPVDDTAE